MYLRTGRKCVPHLPYDNEIGIRYARDRSFAGCGRLVSAGGDATDRAYARTCDPAVVLRSDNAYSAASCAAVTWSSITPATGNYAPAVWSEGMIAVDPMSADHVCFANSTGIAASSDGGGTWTAHALPNNANPACDATRCMSLTPCSTREKDTRALVGQV